MIKRLLAAALALAMLMICCSCKSKETELSDFGAETETATQSQTIQIADVSDDAQDPENVEEDVVGQSVTATKIPVQKGKAKGIDVSKWQGKIDWSKVKADGIDFAIIRIGYRGENGNLYKDANADYNIQQAQNNGISVGVYFFSTAISQEEAQQEANWTVSAIKGYKISYPVAYDCEGYTSPESRMYNLTNTQRTNNAIAFLNAIKNAGYDAMFYASKSDLENHFETARLEKDYFIWLAHYSKNIYPAVQTPEYTGKCDMWQYTNKGKVSGISGNVDMCVSYFTRNEAAPKDETAAPPTAQAPKDTAEQVYKAVVDTVTAKETVNLREAATTKSNIVGTLSNGQFLERTAIGENGWSQLTYNGTTVYAITSYLTTDASYVPPVIQQADIVEGNTFTAVNDNVTAKEETNLRALPSTNSQIVATIKAGEFVQRTAKSDKGWSRLIYQGQTVYAVTNFLTTEFIQPQPEQDTSDGFAECNQTVTAKEETNLRTFPSTTESQVVYTLKNGEYITRIGINEKTGWSKLIYNGQTVYAVSSYIIMQ